MSQKGAYRVSGSELVGTLPVVRDGSVLDVWLAELLHGGGSDLLLLLSHVARTAWGQTTYCPLHVGVVSLP
jgi:hypothetical protein